MKNRKQFCSTRGQRLSRSKRFAGVCAEIVEQRLLLSTYTVNTLSDAINPGAGLLTLRQAIADANDNPGADTIAFDPTVFTPSALHTITLTQGEITFTDTSTTTITGSGSAVLAVSGNSTSRVFDINSGATATISGLQIVNGKQTTADASGNTYGGGILNAGNLTITNSVISGNQVVGSGTYAYNGRTTAGMAFGGGIYSTRSLTITGSTLSNNTVTNSATDIIDSDLTGGAAPDSGTAAGGAIYSASIIPVTLNNDTITGNSASASSDFNGVAYLQYADGGFAAGGGVYASGALIVSDCTITGNTTTAGDASTYGSGQGGNGSGGGLFADGLLTMTASTVENNNLNSGRSSFDGGSSGAAHGGGVDAEMGATITNTTISSNNVTAGDAGFSNGVTAGGGLYAPFGATLNSDTINGNNLLGGPGAPTRDTQGSNITTSGGGIFGGELNINDSSITGNTITSRLQVKSGAVVGGHNVGGGITSAGMSTINNTTVSGNTVVGGHGLYAYGSYLTTYGGNADGGGIFNSGPLTITDSTIVANHTTGGAAADSSANLPGQPGGDANGGAIFTSQNLTIYDSTITGNTATGGKGGAAFSYDNQVSQPAGPAGTPTAGGIDITAGTTLLDNSIFSANTTIAEDDIHGNVSPASAFNLIGVGGGLTNDVNGNKLGINNPLLSALGNNGGSTHTMVPLPGSPAIDAGNNSDISPFGITTDQRGLPRIVNGIVDIGATEVQASIFGTIFNDANGNGKQDTGETGIPSVTVYIDLTNAGTLKSGDPQTTTNASGNYSFTGLVAGTDIVRQILPSGDKQIFPSDNFGNHVTIAAGQTVSGINFADQPISVSTLATITGAVLNGQLGIPNVRVYADLTNAGVFITGDPQSTTNSSGAYTLTGLSAGTYIIRQVLPIGDKQITPTNNFGNHVTVAAAAAISNINFLDQSVSAPASISGEVFNDANGNGIQNSGELSLSGWTVYIDLTNSGTLQSNDPTTTTDSNGDFTFTNLAAGTYILRVISPTGWSQTLPTKNFGQHITLATGQKVNAVLFGEKKS